MIRLISGTRMILAAAAMSFALAACFEDTTTTDSNTNAAGGDEEIGPGSGDDWVSEMLTTPAQQACGDACGAVADACYARLGWTGADENAEMPENVSQECHLPAFECITKCVEQ